MLTSCNIKYCWETATVQHIVYESYILSGGWYMIAKCEKHGEKMIFEMIRKVEIDKIEVGQTIHVYCVETPNSVQHHHWSK